MSTTYYNLPTINGTDTVDGVNAINGLANATDAALRQVANTIPDLSTLNAQVATLTQQVGSAQTTAQNAATAASAAKSTADTAQSTASAAQVTASTVSQAWGSAPVNIRNSYVSTYVETPDEFTCFAWGNVVSIQCGGIKIPSAGRVVVGQINPDYAPTRTLTSLMLAISNGEAMIPGYLQITETGEVAVNFPNNVTPDYNTVYPLYPVGVMTYLCKVTEA